MARAKKKTTKRRFGSPEQLKSGKFRARYTYRGRRWTSPMTFLTEGRAQGWLDSEERLIDRGDWTPPAERAAKNIAGSVSVDEAVDHWITTAGHLAESSRTLYQSVRRNRIAPYLSDVRLDDFTRADAHQWVNTIRAEHKRDGSGLTKRNADAYKLLHAALQAEVDAGTLDVNPCQVKGATQFHKGEEKAVPTLQQLQTILAGLPEHLRAGAQVAAWCGLRPAEWMELRRRDIERHSQPSVRGVEQPDRVVLHIDRQAHKVAGEWIVKPPKGGKTRRVVLPDHLVSVLDDQLRNYAGKGRDGLLFPNVNGGQLTRQKFAESFKLRTAAAGCPKVTPHSLRHFGGTVYAQAGATVAETMKLMGHTTPTVAMMYQHVAASRPEALATAVAAIATAGVSTSPGAPGESEDQDNETNGGGSDGE